MEIIIKAIAISIFVAICLWIISTGINKQLEKELKYQKKLILHIRNELSLLKLKGCPEEEFKNIPFEIIDWIDFLEKESKGVNDSDV